MRATEKIEMRAPHKIHGGVSLREKIKNESPLKEDMRGLSLTEKIKNESPRNGKRIKA